MRVAATGQSSRIPAWKKLGLKLKNNMHDTQDRDTQGTALRDGLVYNGTKKRNVGEGETSSYKKQRLENEKKVNENDNEKFLVVPKKDVKQEKDGINDEICKKNEMRKQKSTAPVTPPRTSVSFSADAKVTDGSEEQPIPTPHPVVSNDPEDIAKRRAAKREKRASRNKNRELLTKPISKPISVPRETLSNEPSVLRYLTTYYKSRSQWKFQKNQETNVLKHSLAMDKIPPSYNDALRIYLNGMKGENAKRRVASLAEEVIRADNAEIDSETANVEREWKDRYKNAICSYRTKLIERQKAPFEPNEKWDNIVPNLDDDTNKNGKFEKRKRAELILSCVGRIPASAEQPFKQQKRKSRKMRTALVEDMTSSSESSDDNERNYSESSSSDGEFSQPRSSEAQSKHSANGIDSSSSSPLSSDGDSSGSDTDSDTSSASGLSDTSSDTASG